ncbi:MAG: chemotaxis protein CheB [Rhizobacter sp.]
MQSPAEALPNAHPDHRLRVVGVGASAGGLDALEKLLKSVPTHSGLAFVVVQHLDPTHKAMLSELLQRSTSMPVAEAEQGTRIEPDHVYVIPPNKGLTVAAGRLQLATPAQPRGLRLPIDLLFESLAHELGNQAVGVVLSGMGSDGAQGLRVIKAQGGMTLAQLPESAQFDAMPQSAIRAGCVDVVAAPEQLVAQILGGQVQPQPEPPQDGEAFDTSLPPGELQGVLELLKRQGRHDFSLYKRSTLGRRIERRMGMHGLSSISAYEQLLQQSPQEIELLSKELLIGVTSFFRDRAVWQALRDVHLPQLLLAHADGQVLRAWVTACSTGEEAYTLAMVFSEALQATPERSACSLQIFATDLSADAIERARRAHYPAAISGEVSAQRLQQFFTPDDGGYRVAKRIREMVVFAPHDVIGSPPFTKLDVLCCRNLLIYFTPPLQKRLLQLFHYSLRAGGLLVLGSSESVGQDTGLFEPLDATSRIYRNRDRIKSVGIPDLPFARRQAAAPAMKELPLPDTQNAEASLQAVADQLLFQQFAPPAVLVNESGDVLYINGHTGKYLEPAAGKANWNIHVMARDSIRAALTDALLQVSVQKKPVELKGLALNNGDNPPQTVEITLRLAEVPGLPTHCVLITFHDVAKRPRPSRRRVGQVADAELQAELQRTREELQALREESKASHEELQATNEELQSTNEELQSTNEELTSSKEEMQSMNEELQSVNGELQSKLNDLAVAQSDMKNLLNSTQIATLFLDNDLNVRRFTEQARKVFRLRESDVGRPLSDLTTSLAYPELHDDARETLRTLVPTEKQIATTDGRWFSVRIMPYRNLEDVIRGVVITLVDITTAKELEAKLRGS